MGPYAHSIALAWAFTLSAGTAKGEVVRAFDARIPLPTAILTTGNLSAAQLSRAVRAGLAANTRLEPSPYRAKALTDCLGALPCLMGQLSRSLDTPFALMVSVLKRGDQDQVTIELIDLKIARRLIGSSVSGSLEAELKNRAIVGGSAQAVLRNETGLRALVSDTAKFRWKAALKRERLFGGWGAIALQVPAGSRLRMNNVEITAPDGRARLELLAPGTYALNISHTAYTELELEVEVKEDETTSLTPRLVPLSAPHSTFRQVTIWSGVGVTGVGAALVIAALASSSKAINCWGDQPCERAFLNAAPPGEPQLFESPNGRGPPLAPLGYSLVLAGGAASLLTWLITEEGELPWLPIVIGLGAGAVSFSASVLANGRTPL